MVIEVSESEMLSRFSDGLKQAASEAKKLGSPVTLDKPKALTDFIHSLKVSAGSAHQLGIYRENLQMLKIRNIIEGVIEEASNLVLDKNGNSTIWNKISEYLLTMSKKGVEMANSKSMPRSEILAKIDHQRRTMDLENGSS